MFPPKASKIFATDPCYHSTDWCRMTKPFRKENLSLSLSLSFPSSLPTVGIRYLLSCQRTGEHLLAILSHRIYLKHTVFTTCCYPSIEMPLPSFGTVPCWREEQPLQKYFMLNPAPQGQSASLLLGLACCLSVTAGEWARPQTASDSGWVFIHQLWGCLHYAPSLRLTMNEGMNG